VVGMEDKLLCNVCAKVCNSGSSLYNYLVRRG
jgi:hypothetical protein